MRLDEFEVTVSPGSEDARGYVEMRHGQQYAITLQNDGARRCDAEIKIDGRLVGTWRVNARTKAVLERPVHDTGKFTFYRLRSADGVRAGLERSDDLGLISVTFMPERRSEGGDMLFAAKAAKAGGTGLSGKSKQEFDTVRPLDYADELIIVSLRLVDSGDMPRPMFPRSNPVPPPLP